MRSLQVLGAALLLTWSAQASIITLNGTLSGANENPPIATAATGFVTVTIDTVALTIGFNVSFSGLTSNDTAAHIHCCIAPPGNTSVATALPALPGFPLNATSGLFNPAIPFSLLDSAIYNPSFVTAHGGTVQGAESALLTGLLSDQTYFNIHTLNNPGGEIRAFLVPTPDPGTAILTGLALTALAIFRRRELRKMTR